MVRADGVTVVRAFCEPYERETPYYALRFVLRTVAGVTEGGTVGGGQLRAAVERAAPHLLARLPLLATVVDVEVPPTREVDDLEPRFRRARTRTVVTEFLTALATQPLLVVVEDGQWLDTLSAEVLAALGAVAADRPWLVCVVRRDGDALEAGETSLPLGPLAEDAVRALISAATLESPLLPHVRDAIVARAGGNPLFVEELLRSRAGANDDEPLPESLEAVVATQIDRLAPRERRLLRYASVLGPTFDPSLLAIVTDGELRSVAEATARLSPFVEAAGTTLLRFRNGCYRQIAYDALPFRRRRQLHALAGDALAAAGGRRDAKRASALSMHYLHAQRYDECWRASLEAATAAEASYANVEAGELYERALQVRTHVKDLDAAHVAAVWEARADVAVRAGDIDRARAAYRRARALRAGDPVSLAIICSKEYRTAMHQGRSDAALRWVRRGLRLLDGAMDHGAVSWRAQLRYFYAHNRQQAGRPRDALRWAELAVADAQAAGDHEVLSSAYLLQDWALLALGRPAEATNAVAALPILEALDKPERTAQLLLYLGNFAYMQGKWDDALDLWTRASDAYERAGNTVDATYGVSNTAEVLVHQGRYDEAEPRLRQALETWESMGYAGGVGDVLGNLARLALNRGDVERALELFERVRETFRAAGDAREIGASGALAECLLRKGEIARALDLLDAAMRREQLSGDRAFAAMLHRLRGYGYAAEGRLTDAWAEFDESLAVARASGAVYEVALTLEAISVVAELGGLAEDPSAAEERAALLAQLGVQVTPPPPLRIAA